MRKYGLLLHWWLAVSSVEAAMLGTTILHDAGDMLKPVTIEYGVRERHGLQPGEPSYRPDFSKTAEITDYDCHILPWPFIARKQSGQQHPDFANVEGLARYDVAYFFRDTHCRFKLPEFASPAMPHVVSPEIRAVAIQRIGSKEAALKSEATFVKKRPKDWSQRHKHGILFSMSGASGGSRNTHSSKETPSLRDSPPTEEGSDSASQRQQQQQQQQEQKQEQKQEQEQSEPLPPGQFKSALRRTKAQESLHNMVPQSGSSGRMEDSSARLSNLNLDSPHSGGGSSPYTSGPSAMGMGMGSVSQAPGSISLAPGRGSAKGRSPIDGTATLGGLSSLDSASQPWDPQKEADPNDPMLPWYPGRVRTEVDPETFQAQTQTQKQQQKQTDLSRPTQRGKFNFNRRTQRDPPDQTQDDPTRLPRPSQPGQRRRRTFNPFAFLVPSTSD